MEEHNMTEPGEDLSPEVLKRALKAFKKRLKLTALVSYGSLLLTIAVFWPAGRDEACAAGLCASTKNMAVMVAAVLGTVDPRISLVVITAQFPIFLSPLLMRPLFAYLRRQEVQA